MTTEKNYHRYLRHTEDVQDFFTLKPKWPPKIIELSQEQKNIQSCFGNDIIMARIMEHAVDWSFRTNNSAKDILAWRTVSKCWSDPVLSEFRRRSRTNKVLICSSYRDRLSYSDAVRNFDTLPEKTQQKYYRLFINNYWVRFNNYHPINNDAELQVLDICTKNPHLNQILHKEIIGTLYGAKKSYLKKIFGMKLLCDGCEMCIDFADQCEEHDFVTMKKLEKGFPDGKIFRNIGVAIKDQNEIIQRCIDASEDMESCLKIMANLIKNNITAENITFTQDRLSEAIWPGEVFQVFIRQWSAKSIEMNLCFDDSDPENKTIVGRFSEFSLMEKRPNHPETALNWSAVSIERLAERHGFEHMVSAFRKVVPSKKLYLDNIWICLDVPDEWPYPNTGYAQELVMQEITNYATDENLSNFELELTIPDHATFDVGKLCNTLNLLGRSWEIQETIYGKDLGCRCGRRSATYKMANNRTQGWLIISMTEYIPDHPYRCHSGDPHPIEYVVELEDEEFEEFDEFEE
ncbi:hypothetical protein B9Z55_022811 [Caenorhabditis nigoni]|uniref:Uncharacterized protein n=1 Tax=Caenorhabditis nigoni TaxID=1611254 RepID=A0A2G5SM26_9PELO|nr:hypothetical protein B9Z55_022811 [Caenorhabditis nigoni]